MSIGINYDVRMASTSSLHYSDSPKKADEKDDVTSSFSDMLKSSIDKVNDLQKDSEKLNQKMIYEPESVDIHQVMIAGQKAEVSMLFVKSVRDEAIKAYRELMNLR